MTIFFNAICFLGVEKLSSIFYCYLFIFKQLYIFMYLKRYFQTNEALINEYWFLALIGMAMMLWKNWQDFILVLTKQWQCMNSENLEKGESINIIKFNSAQYF